MPDEPAAPEAPVEAPPALPDWIAALCAAAPDGVTAVLGVPGGAGDADLPVLVVTPERWFELAAACKAAGFTLFADLGGVDHPEQEARLEVNLHLRDLATGRLIRLKTAVPDGGELASLEPLFGGAGWPEREVFDLLGVRFRGNADLRRLLLPDDWSGHPLRRDYPLTGPRALDPESPYAV